MLEIIFWVMVSFMAWPTVEFLWNKVVFPFIEWSILSVGKKGFSPLISSVASSMLWGGIGTLTVNALAWAQAHFPKEMVSIGFQASDISGIIPTIVAVPLFFGAIVLNALAHKWSK